MLGALLYCVVGLGDTVALFPSFRSTSTTLAPKVISAGLTRPRVTSLPTADATVQNVMLAGWVVSRGGVYHAQEARRALSACSPGCGLQPGSNTTHTSGPFVCRFLLFFFFFVLVSLLPPCMHTPDGVRQGRARLGRARIGLDVR